MFCARRILSFTLVVFHVIDLVKPSTCTPAEQSCFGLSPKKQGNALFHSLNSVRILGLPLKNINECLTSQRLD